MKRFFAILLALILILGAVFTIRFISAPQSCEKTAFALNTVIKISVWGKDASVAADAALKEIRRIDGLMSAHSTSSEIYALNTAGVGKEVKVSKEVFDLIKLARDIWQKSGGAFDITLKPLSDLWNIQAENPKVPKAYEIESALKKTGFEYVELNESNCTVTFKKDGMSADLGAIAKGYAADRAAQILKEHGIKSALIDLGGNIYALGRNKNGQRWKIGLQTPWTERGEYFETVEAENKAVVTSGAYERYFEKDGKIYHHIIDPETGCPSQSGISSVTVIYENSAVADALSTAVFVSGKQCAETMKSIFGDIEIIIVTNDGKTIKY